jgi:hypothetical protein
MNFKKIIYSYLPEFLTYCETNAGGDYKYKKQERVNYTVSVAEIAKA